MSCAEWRKLKIDLILIYLILCEINIDVASWANAFIQIIHKENEIRVKYGILKPQSKH